MVSNPPDRPAFGFREDAPVYVTHPDRAAFLDDMEARLQRGETFSVATVNLDHVVRLARDPAFAAAYSVHSHVVADGNPVVWLSRLAGRPVDLIPGSELIHPLCARAAAAEAGVALVGATDATLAAAATALGARFPRLRIVLRNAPPMGFDPEGPGADAIAGALRESGAGIAFLALGAPRQERLAAYLQDRVPGCGLVSIGAGLDFIAGSQKRAPAAFRGLALEWAWRLLHDPQRLGGRYAACAAVLPVLTVRALRARLG